LACIANVGVPPILAETRSQKSVPLWELQRAVNPMLRDLPVGRLSGSRTPQTSAENLWLVRNLPRFRRT
jgi:hypothetical protein